MILGMMSKVLLAAGSAKDFFFQKYTGDGNYPRLLSSNDMSDGGFALLNPVTGGGDILYSVSGSSVFRKEINGGVAAEADESSLLVCTSTGLRQDGTLRFYNSPGQDNVIYSLSKEAGICSVVEYTGTGSAQSIAHGLGETPEFVLVVPASSGKLVSFQIKGFAGNSILFGPGSAQSTLNFWNSTSADSTNVYLGDRVETNASGEKYTLITAGGDLCQQRIYTGNGSATGPTVDFGWQPDVVIIKGRTGSRAWCLLDQDRSPGFTGDEQITRLGAIGVLDGEYISLTSTGIQLQTSNTLVNSNLVSYTAVGFRKKPA